MTSRIRAVVFDLRGTLVTELIGEDWTREALRRTGLAYSGDTPAELLRAIKKADGQPSRLASPTGNTSFERHRDTYYEVFTDAGLDDDLADALFAVDSDFGYNTFATDARETLVSLVQHGCRVAVLSNIHLDPRPLFEEAGLLDLVKVWALSFELGIQKPDPAIFRHTVKQLGTQPEQTLMVGDRPSRDGVAVQVGMPTQLVPTLTDPHQRRLWIVTDAVGASTPAHACLCRTPQPPQTLASDT